MVHRGVKVPWFVSAPDALNALCSLLQSAYPTLHADEVGGKIVVRGSFSVAFEGNHLDWYLLELALPEDYPASPSLVRELGGRIPREMDHHVNGDGSLCLAVAEEMWIKWNGKFDIGNFLEGPVRTFLIRNSLVEIGAKWPHGERPHGAAGVCEFYRELIGIGEPEKVLLPLGYLSKERVKGHWVCPCGSGKLLRSCHMKSILGLHSSVPSRVIQQSIAILKGEYGPSA